MALPPGRRVVTPTKELVMQTPFSRRRFIGITAAAAGLSLVPLGSRAHDATVITWRGQAMGAVAELKIHHHDRLAAEHLLEQTLAEVRRLERVFSLYRDNSALVALNRDGMLVAPARGACCATGRMPPVPRVDRWRFRSDGAVLWRLYRDHLSRPGADVNGPPAAAVDAARAHIGLDGVSFDRNRVSFARKGQPSPSTASRRDTSPTGSLISCARAASNSLVGHG